MSLYIDHDVYMIYYWYSSPMKEATQYSAAMKNTTKLYLKALHQETHALYPRLLDLSP